VPFVESKQATPGPHSKLLGIAHNEARRLGAKESVATVGQVWRKIVYDVRNNRPS
jgi:hypothetical protein